ncbi:conserved domain protein [delta proteobacterium NaphS2]|nr:conserved domain protein [delta proteobacterium NaphS2]
MKQLVESKAQVEAVSAQLLDVLDGNGGREVAADLVNKWSDLKTFETRFDRYLEENVKESSVAKRNEAQHALSQAFDPFFEGLHQGLKQLDKTVRRREREQAERARKKGRRKTADKQLKELKSALEALHVAVKDAEGYYRHIHWLQDRFPNAEYEDVIGLCKLADPEEVAEQDYSLNPGRYVGVVIEEDGKTEEEFIQELLAMDQELSELNKEARALEKIIHQNVLKLTGEE